MADRDVTYHLAVKPADDAKRALDTFKREVLALRGQIEQLEKAGAKTILAEVERAKKELSSLRSGFGGTGVGGAGRTSISDAIVREHNRGIEAQVKGLEKLAKEADKTYKAKAKSASDALKIEEREMATLLRQQETATKKAASATDQFFGRLAQTGESVARFGRGLATLGVLGEDSTEKLIKGLAKVQAGFDLFVGAIQTIRNVQKAMEALKTITTASAAAKELENQAAARAATQSAAVTAALGAEAAAASAAAAAHAALNAARGGMGGGKPGGGAGPGKGKFSGMPGSPGIMDSAGSTLGMIRDIALTYGALRGAGGASKGASGLLGGGIPATNWLGMMRGLGSGVRGVGVGLGGLLGTVAGAGTAAAVGVGAAGASGYGVYRHAQEYGFGGGAPPDTWTGAQGERLARLAAWIPGVYSGMNRSIARTKSMEARAEEIRAPILAQLAAREAEEERGGIRAGAMQDRWSLRDQTLDRGGLVAYRRELAGAQGALKGMAPDATIAEREAMERRVADLHGKVADLTRNRLEQEKDIARTRQESVRDTIRGLQDELKARREAEKEARGEYVDRKAEFGRMDPIEQMRMLAAGRKAQALAASGMGAAGLTRDERELLGRSGSAWGAAMAKQGDVMAADRAGYDLVFGAEERRRRVMEARTQAALEVKVKGAQAVNVKIEQNLNEMTRQVGNVVETHLAQQRRQLEQLITAELNRRLGQQNRDRQTIQAQRRHG